MARRSPFDAEGNLTDLPVDISYYDVLDLPVTLRLDEEELREKFYALSRLVHPDRFVSAAPQQARYAMRWTTALNRAYQTLREPAKRARYLLDMHGTGEKKAPPVPMELAESYFELQDLLTEPGGEARIADFKKELENQVANGGKEWDCIAEAWDLGSDQKTTLARLERHLVLERYLQSMIADIERKMGNDDGNSRH